MECSAPIPCVAQVLRRRYLPLSGDRAHRGQGDRALAERAVHGDPVRRDARRDGSCRDRGRRARAAARHLRAPRVGSGRAVARRSSGLRPTTSRLRGIPPPCRQAPGGTGSRDHACPGRLVSRSHLGGRAAGYVVDSPRIRLPERYGPGSGRPRERLRLCGAEWRRGGPCRHLLRLGSPGAARTLLGPSTPSASGSADFCGEGDRGGAAASQDPRSPARAARRHRRADGEDRARVGTPLAGLSMLTRRIARRLGETRASPLGSVQDVVEQLVETTRRST